MADTAAHLVDHVLPEVPIRQWVLTLPYPLRYRCAYDARLTSAVLRAFLRALFAELRRRARKQWRLGDRVEPELADADPEASASVPQHGGMSLHADVAVPARDRPRLERLCRYVARPPLANDRLEERADGRLTLRLKTRWRDGTTHILMERSELIERLVPLIPPPRAHQVRYHRVLAPGASTRDRVVPGESKASQEAALAPGQPSEAAGREAPVENPPAGRALERSDEQPAFASDSRNRARRARWASLLQRVFEIDALRCPQCGSTLRLIAAIEDPAVARKILECLALPARAPPLEPAVADIDLGHTEEDWHFDQSPILDEP